MYVVNKNQQAIFWSTGMGALSGFQIVNVNGKQCLTKYVFDPVSNVEEQSITLIRTDGEQIEVIRTVHTLPNMAGKFAGAIDLIAKALEAIPNAFITNEPEISQQKFHCIISRSTAMQDVCVFSSKRPPKIIEAAIGNFTCEFYSQPVSTHLFLSR